MPLSRLDDEQFRRLTGLVPALATQRLDKVVFGLHDYGIPRFPLFRYFHNFIISVIPSFLSCTLPVKRCILSML